MKTTLFALNSSFVHTNLAIRYLADSLKKAGIDSDLCERNIKDKHHELLYELYCRNSDIYAFSVYIWNIDIMIELAQELKSLNSEAIIIFGGPEVSYENEDYFKNHPYVDILISGEGESVFPKICSDPKRYLKKCVKGEQSNLFKTAGILYDKYPAKGSIVYYESSRGCPHRCSYCLSSLTKGIRAKDAQQTLSELLDFEKLDNKPQIIKFIDRTFNYDIDRAKDIWRGLCDSKYTLNYHFEICADTLDEECFEIFSSMPPGKIQFEAGIQSTNEKTLKEINRKTNNTKALNNLLRIKQLGNIHVHADLIAGLPYEDTASFRRSFDDTIVCCDKLQLGFLKLLKGSSIRNAAEKHGYKYYSKAPYTVLCNKYMTYDDIYHLMNMAAVIDRIYSSNRFSYTMEYIISKSTSPYLVFCELSKRLNCIDKISQHECNRIIYEYLKERFTESEPIERLALDTLINENKNPPQYLNGYYKTESLSKYYNDLKGKYAYRFAYDPEYIYIIDRTAHVVYKKRCIQ